MELKNGAQPAADDLISPAEVDEARKPGLEFVNGPPPQPQIKSEPSQVTVTSGENLPDQEQQIVKKAQELSRQLKSQLEILGLDANHLFVDRLHNDLLTQFSGLAEIYTLVKELSAQKDAVGSNQFPNQVRRFFHDITGLTALQVLSNSMNDFQTQSQRLESAEEIYHKASQVMFARMREVFVAQQKKLSQLVPNLVSLSDQGISVNDLKLSLTELTSAVYGANIDGEDLPQHILLAELVGQLNQWVALHNQSEVENNRGDQLLIKIESDLSQIDGQALNTSLTTSKAVVFLSNLISNARKAYLRRKIEQDEPNFVAIKIEGIIKDGTPVLMLRVDDFAGGFDSGSTGERVSFDEQELQTVELGQIRGGWRAQDQPAASPPRLVAQSRNVGLRAQMEFVQILGGDYQVGTRFDRAKQEPVGATVLVELPLQHN